MRAARRAPAPGTPGEISPAVSGAAGRGWRRAEATAERAADCEETHSVSLSPSGMKHRLERRCPRAERSFRVPSRACCTRSTASGVRSSSARGVRGSRARGSSSRRRSSRSAWTQRNTCSPRNGRSPRARARRGARGGACRAAGSRPEHLEHLERRRDPPERGHHVDPSTRWRVARSASRAISMPVCAAASPVGARASARAPRRAPASRTCGARTPRCGSRERQDADETGCGTG